MGSIKFKISKFAAARSGRSNYCRGIMAVLLCYLIIMGKAGVAFFDLLFCGVIKVL